MAKTKNYSPMAIVSFVLGLSFLLPWITPLFGFYFPEILIILVFTTSSILAIIFGFVTLKQIKKNKKSGKPLAIWGIVLGFVGFFLLITWFIIALGISHF